jgi:hypothetical protein
MTAVASHRQEPRRLFGLLPPKPAPVLIDGKPIHGRAIQQLIWGAVLGTVLFGLFFSGLYYGGTQVHWYVHLGGFYWRGVWVKPHWDGGMGIIHAHTWLINTANWPDYRHPYRNIGLGAFAVMGALSITGGSKKMASRWYTALAPLLVLIAALVLITAGVWVTLWANARWGPASHLVTALEAALLAVIVGRVLHTIWKPAGTRIQHFLVERGVDRHFRRGGVGLPRWVRHPLAPPTMREAAATLIAEDEASGEASALRAEGHTRKSSTIWWIAGTVLVLVLAFDFLGFIGHFWVGVLGHNFPYLAPGS